jgi:hypothetical protein
VDPAITRPDPSIVWDPSSQVYRMFATQTWSGHAPEWQSPSITGPWTFVRDALPSLPAWHGGSFTTWAPVVQDINGVWTMWGSTGDRQGNFCLYRATARTAAGPFAVDPRRIPCDVQVNGDIDPSMVNVAGQWWLLDKTNANGVGRPTTFFSQRLGPDGLPSGARFTLLTSDQPWEAGMIEAPSMVKDPSGNQWWIVFSAGRTTPNNPTYQIYIAPCDGVEGPCHAQRAAKLIGPNTQGAAPGEENVFVAADGQLWIAYNPNGFFIASSDRPLALVRLEFDRLGEPFVASP